MGRVTRLTVTLTLHLVLPLPLNSTLQEKKERGLRKGHGKKDG